MSTVTKEIADAVVAGSYPEDEWVRIVKYENAWGGIAYGITASSDAWMKAKQI